MINICEQKCPFRSESDTHATHNKAITCPLGYDYYKWYRICSCNPRWGNIFLVPNLFTFIVTLLSGSFICSFEFVDHPVAYWCPSDSTGVLLWWLNWAGLNSVLKGQLGLCGWGLPALNLQLRCPWLTTPSPGCHHSTFQAHEPQEERMVSFLVYEGISSFLLRDVTIEQHITSSS